MYQIYKQYVHQEVADFVPLIMTTITLQPPAVHKYVFPIVYPSLL